MLIEIHMLKNYGPTNLNRDDTGSPKTCTFGGVQRARISSQCLKRSWRTSPLLKGELGEHIGVRTRYLPKLVVQRIEELGVAPEYLPLAEKKLSGFANKDGKENKDGNWTTQVVIYSPQDIEAVAQAVKEQIDKSGSVKGFEKISAKELEKTVQGAKTRPVSLDIALFGRMVTSDAFANVEAAMQVAHAVSTHRVTMESDFFTAMDDLIAGGENDGAGSGMMGDIDYNASCYYIYASLDTDKLLENLQFAPDPAGLVEIAIPALLRTMAFSNPGGKQNTFAGHSLPSAVLVECREYPVPVSYINAFVKPVYLEKGFDIVSGSVERLINHVKQTDEKFALPVKKRLWFCIEQAQPLQGAEVCESFPHMVKALTAAVK